MEKIITRVFRFTALSALLFSVVPIFAQAATLTFSPQSGSYTVGSIIKVAVNVTSTDQPMNAASAEVSFPTDKLSVISISKTNSIMTLWPQEPVYSNTAGTIDFASVALTPGFTGSNGQILSITFQAKAAGTAPIGFASAAVLANDGLGTNILTGTGNAQFTIGAAQPQPTPSPSATVGAPNAPDIQSSTYPDQNAWYTATDGVFAWGVPTDVTADRILVSQSPSATPSVVYNPPITSKEVTNTSDGIWYFSAQLENDSGWSVPAHFKFQIDTQPPLAFSVRFPNGSESDDPQPKVFFTTTDALSGVAYYTLQIDNDAPIRVNASDISDRTPYALPLQTPGTKTLTVTAYDQAGNSRSAQATFIVDPLTTPVITNYPTSLTVGNILTIGGTTNYPNAQVIISLQRGNEPVKNFTVQTQGDGSFIFTTDENFGDGTYSLWAIVKDPRGAVSYPSQKLNITFNELAFFRIGSFAVSVLEVIVTFFILLFLLALEIWYARHRFLIIKKKIRKETRDAENLLHKAFSLLKEDVKEQIKLLEKVQSKRQLTEEETKIIESLKRDLEDAEGYVRKEIDTIDQIVE